MKSKKMIALTMGTIVLITGIFTGCSDKNNSSNETSEVKKVSEEQKLNLLNEEPRTLDPSKSADVYGTRILNAISEQLARTEVAEDGEEVVKPAGAEKWEVSDDKLIWTFHLRDFNWEDGKPVTAKDYEYSLKRTLNPETASDYAYLLAPIKNAKEYNSSKAKEDEVGIKAIDDKTLQIVLDKPCSYFEKLLSVSIFTPQRKDIVEKYGNKFGTEADTIMATGPFKLKSWEHNSKIELEKNEEYWDKNEVKLQDVNFRIIKEEAAQINSLASGEIDSLNITKPEAIKRFKETGEYDNVKGYSGGINYLVFNQKSKLFSNVNIRKAFSLAMDRAELNKTMFHNNFEEAYGWCTPKMLLGDKDFRSSITEPLKNLNENPKELLKKGLKELGMDTDPSKITVTYLQGNSNQWAKSYTEVLQQIYKKTLGITIKGEYTQFAIYQDRVAKLDFELAGAGWTGDYSDPNTLFDMFLTGNTIIPTGGWSNKQYDSLITKAQHSSDNKERLDLYKKAEDILVHKDAVVSPTLYRTRNSFTRKYVKNVMRPTFGADIELKYAYIEGKSK